MSNQLPAWAHRLLEQLADAVEFQGLATLEGRHLEPDETDWGVDLIELAPALLDLVEAGPQDGAQTYGLVSALDLFALNAVFDRIDHFALDFDEQRQPRVTLEGRFEAHEVAVVIYFTPFEDAEISGRLDLTGDTLQISWDGDDGE